jgi:flavodoxin
MANILIITGSVYGGAQFVAEQIQELLQGQGHQVEVDEDPNIAVVQSSDNDTILLITSTTGSGDLPDNIITFASQVRDQLPQIPNKRYGVIALGDKSYGDTFCGAGKQLDELFSELSATKLGERLEIDACETLQPEDEALPWAESWAKLL